MPPIILNSGSGRVSHYSMENSNQEVLTYNEENQKAGWSTTLGAIELGL